VKAIHDIRYQTTGDKKLDGIAIKSFVTSHREVVTEEGQCYQDR